MSELEHYFLTAHMRGGYMHGYLMTGNRDDMERACSKLLYEIERRGEQTPMTDMILLSTRLNPDGVKRVRTFIRRFPAIKETLAKATNFHLSMWETPPIGFEPDVDRLMALH
jgi:hypothetical protein